MNNEKDSAAVNLEALIESVDRVADDSCTSITEKTKRDRAIEALTLRAAGVPVTQIERRTGLVRGTVYALESRHQELVEMLRHESARSAATAARKGMEILNRKFNRLDADDELLDKTPIQQIAISAAVAVDKAQILTSNPTSIMKHQHSISFEDYQRTIREARSRVAARVIEAEEIEGE